MAVEMTTSTPLNSAAANIIKKGHALFVLQMVNIFLDRQGQKQSQL